jgi:hypothetical protein
MTLGALSRTTVVASDTSTMIAGWSGTVASGTSTVIAGWSGTVDSGTSAMIAGWSGTVASAVKLAHLVAWVAMICVAGVAPIRAAGQVAHGTLATATWCPKRTTFVVITFERCRM